VSVEMKIQRHVAAIRPSDRSPVGAAAVCAQQGGVVKKHGRQTCLQCKG